MYKVRVLQLVRATIVGSGGRGARKTCACGGRSEGRILIIVRVTYGQACVYVRVRVRVCEYSVLGRAAAHAL